MRTWLTNASDSETLSPQRKKKKGGEGKGAGGKEEKANKLPGSICKGPRALAWESDGLVEEKVNKRQGVGA